MEGSFGIPGGGGYERCVELRGHGTHHMENSVEGSFGIQGGGGYGRCDKLRRLEKEVGNLVAEGGEMSRRKKVEEGSFVGEGRGNHRRKGVEKEGREDEDSRRNLDLHGRGGGGYGGGRRGIPF